MSSAKLKWGKWAKILYYVAFDDLIKFCSTSHVKYQHEALIEHKILTFKGIVQYIIDRVAVKSKIESPFKNIA